jgi:hypothetical protein
MLGIDDPSKYGYSAKAKASLTSSNAPLISYLNDKMRVGKLNDDGVVCTMIGAWLVELYLNERERGQDQALHPFLSLNVDNMDAKTILRILSSHDVSASECAEYAAASGDIGTAVSAALSAGNDLTVSDSESVGDAVFAQVLTPAIDYIGRCSGSTSDSG